MSEPESDAGSTLIETLVATAAALLVLVLVAAVCRVQTVFARGERARVEVRENARRIARMVAREARGAGFDPLVAGPFDGRGESVANAAADALELLSDGGAPDGIADPGSDERVRFFRRSSSAPVHHGIGDRVVPLTSDEIVPERFTLRYFDGCGAELVPPPNGSLGAADRSRVRRIDVGLAFRAPGGEARAEAIATAALRNREAECFP